MLIFKFLFLFIYAVSSILGYIVNADEKVEYKFVFEKLEQEVKTDDILATNLSFDKKGDEVFVNGEVKQQVDLDNDWKVKILVFRADKAEDEYKQMVALPEKGVCDIMKSYYKSYFYESMKNYANAPDPENCPVTQETYTVNGYPLDTSPFKKFMKPGYYRLICSLFSNEVEKLKYVVHGHAEEDK